MTSKRKTPSTTQTAITKIREGDLLRFTTGKCIITDDGERCYGAGSALRVRGITSEIRHHHHHAKGHRYYTVDVGGETISLSSARKVARVDDGQDVEESKIDILPERLAEAQAALVEPRQNIHPDDRAEFAATMTDPARFPQAQNPWQALSHLQAELFILADIARKRARVEAQAEAVTVVEGPAAEPAAVDSQATEAQEARRSADPLTRTAPPAPQMSPQTRPPAPEFRLDVNSQDSLFDIAGAPRLPF